MTATEQQALWVDDVPAADSGGEQQHPPGLPLERTLASVAFDGVAVLVHWLVILILLSQAVTLVLRPPQGVAEVGAFSGLVCLLWATFTVGMGIMRGKRPDGRDLPPPVWLSVVASAGCLVSVSFIRVSADMAGPWPVEVVACGLLVVAVTVWLGSVAGGIAGLALGGAALGVSLSGSPEDALLRTPAAGAVPGLALLAAAFAVALALGVLRRSAGQLQRTLDERDAALVRERAVRAAGEVAAEVERSLHDTALNTLETIAAHGDHLDTGDVVRRCRSDATALASWRSDAEPGNLGRVLTALLEHAERLGLTVDVLDLRDPGHRGRVDVPPPVLRALLGAGTEALTNVAKHAGVDRARLLVDHTPSEVRLVVSDDGIGAGPGRPGADGQAGFGLVNSVHRRMASVGGTVLMVPGQGGRGTEIDLEWQPEVHADPATSLGSDLLLRTAGVAVLVAWLLALTGSVVLVVGWAAYDRPWMALAKTLLPAIVAAWLLEQARGGVRIGASHVVAAASTCVLAGALSPLADPYCSSLLGEGALVDARAALLAVVLLLAPREPVLAVLVSTVVATHVAGALVWARRWPACGEQTALAGVIVLAALAATWLFIRRIQRVSCGVELARAQANAANVRVAAQLSVRAEEELWVADTLASAQGVLAQIADRRLHPGDPGTRSLCAAEAAFLRGLLAVGRAPVEFRRAARIWLRLLRTAGCRVSVRGAYATSRPPARTIGEIGGLLDTICVAAPGADVTIFTWADDVGQALSVTAHGPQVAAAGDMLARRFERVAPGAWHDVADDSATSQWQWPTAQAARGTDGG